MLGRRSFLTVSSIGGAGLLAGFSLWGCKSRDDRKAAAPDTTPSKTDGAPVDLNAWIRIDPDGTVTMIIDESEMGQGVLTSLPMILAEELHADWSKVRSEHAPSRSKLYGRQGTGGSTSVRRGWDNLRKAGASVREMLIGAAAANWQVPASECRAEAGTVIHEASGRKAGFGELAGAAAKIQPPPEPSLTDRAKFRIVGTKTRRLDSRAKTDGTAVYGIDVKVDGMLVAQVAHCPIFGGKVASFDGSKAQSVPGVRKVVEIPTGVAVIADHFWAANQGRQALAIVWNDAGNAKLSSASITSRCAEVVGRGLVAREQGAAEQALAKAGKGNRRGAAKLVRAIYEVPYLAHAPLEPLNCTADVRSDRCEIWVPTQAPSQTHALAAEITGLPEDKIAIHTTLLGGGFGRRSQTDFVADALHASKAAGKPVKVIWSREDDIQGGWYRPMAYNELTGSIEGGAITAWIHRIASPSILAPMGRPLEKGLDGTSIEGAANLPYSVPNLLVTWADPQIPISTWFWRSVGSSQNAYVTECFFDELAAAGGVDAYELRRKLLVDRPRHLRVLELAADKAGWGKPPAAGIARGIAVHESFGSFVAQVAEVSIEAGDQIKVHRVVCAVDCGDVINPDTVEAQIESSIAYGLSAALYGEVAIADGRAVPANFDTYPVVRMAQMPRVETHIVRSGEALGGIGEPGLPPIAPAVVNALFALRKQPIRRLPIKLA
jgi:isoquinoline 1-oxidoreductase beta subunit